MNLDILHPNHVQLMTRWPVVRDYANYSAWTSSLELAWLAEAASRCQLVGEVGSYAGKSAKAMAWGTPGKVICCDRFQDNTEARFRQNLKVELETGKVRLLAMDSLEGAALLKAEGVLFDFFFIDAAHEAADVLADLKAWAPLVRPGGIVCGHDFERDDPDNGVHAALLEFKPDFHHIADTLWAYIQK